MITSFSKTISVHLVLILILCKVAKSYIVDSNPNHHKEVLDPRGKYVLEWLVDLNSKTIVFNVTVKTKGYVGFGLTKDGRMNGADVVIGGVKRNGESYFNDMHVTSNRTLREDRKQDWKLLTAWEKGGFTFLSFSRLLDTCDENDYLISMDQVTLIWAYSERDEIENHYQNRGTFSAYLLDPDVTPDIDALVNQRNRPTISTSSGPVQQWKLQRRYRLPTRRTSYWCSIHAGPKLPHKHHVIGFRTYLENEDARKHTHHLLVYRCKAPEGIDPQVFFEPFTKYPGEECFLNENRRIPLNLCRDVLSIWGYGGKPFFLPETVGFPIGESQNEYFLFEAHYDNPDLRSDLEFASGVEYFITPKTRKREGGVLTVGFDIPGSLAAIPPGSSNFSLIGHCNSNCTKTMMPSQGVDVVAVGLHAHTTARQIRLRQFQGNQELPWIMNDDNFNPNFQQVRLLQQERKIMPGDHLISRCIYDNTLANGTTTITGFGTPDEMCLSFVIIANRIPYFRCTSEYPAQKLLSLLGVEDVIWDIERQQRLVVSPPLLQGLTLSQVADYHVHWTEELRMYLEKDIMYNPHVVTCPTSAVPSAQQFLMSFSQQLGQSSVNAGGQALQEIVRRGVSQLLQLGVRGILQSLSSQSNPSQGSSPQQLQSGLRSSSQGQTGQTNLSQLPTFGGAPVFPQGTPPTGVSGLGVPPNVVYPKGATVYRPNPSCTRPSAGEQFHKASFAYPQLGHNGLKRVNFRTLRT